MTVMLAERTAPAPRMGTTEKLDYCRALAASGLLPAQYRQQPANLLYAVEFADSLGLHPMVAITGVHVIEGKPSASSALISALVRRAGHKLRVKGDALKAVAQVIRADDPEYAFEVVFTLDDADRAGLLGKKVWKQYPASMLKARAISAVARDACEEALFGIHYTPEELGAEVDADGEPIEGTWTRQPQQADAWQQPAPPAPAVAKQQPWDAAAEGDLSGGRDWINEATEAATADAVVAVWHEAKAAGATEGVLAEVVRIGKEKRAAEQQQPTDAELRAALGSPHQDVVTAAEGEMDRQRRVVAAEVDPTRSTAGSGTTAAGAMGRAPGSPAPEPVADALPGAPDDRKALGLATADMLAAGAAVGVSAPEVWQMLAGRYGHGSVDTTVAELRTIEAELRLRAAADRAQLATVDSDFQNVYGLPIGQASVQQLDGFRARIEAAGGQQ